MNEGLYNKHVKYILLVLSVLFSLVIYGQKTTEKYLESTYLSSEIKNPKKANYKAVITDFPNGDKRTDIIKIKNNDTISSESFNGEEPVGKWKVLEGSKVLYLDYNFVLDFDTTVCSSSCFEKWESNADSLTLNLYKQFWNQIMRNITEQFYVHAFLQELRTYF